MSSYEIKVRVTNEDELYNPLDPDGKTLNSDITDYIKSFSTACKGKESISLKFISENRLDEGRLIDAFKAMFHNEQEKLRQEKRHNTLKQIWMFIVGCFFIILSTVSYGKLPQLVTLIWSTIGSFAMWEAAAVWIVQNPANKMRQRWLNKLTKTDLKFEVTGRKKE